jgi:3-hydroxy-9,10-secoandrosta-1,3,5(10)-triene-9,17-dione monooxygenase
MTQTIDGLLERIAALRPTPETNADQTEADRRVVEENITLLKEAGAFKIMVPARYGGWQMSYLMRHALTASTQQICCQYEPVRPSV